MKNKSTLAKLLAEEDVNVVHKQMETAYFNSKSRELGLPIWKDEEMTKDIYDLMVCHEIGHALWTPLDMLEKAALRKINHSFVNIIEDARIERKVKNKYAGTIGVFSRGYNELLTKDFFGTADKGIVFIGSGDRELVENEPEKGVITQAQSKAIWEIYAKYLGKPIEIILSANTPVRDVYEYADANSDKALIVGAGGPRETKPGVFDKGDMKRYEYFEKNAERYPLVSVVQIPSQEKGMRGTVMRELLAKDLDAGIEAFAPLGDDGISETDKDAIKNILTD